MTLLVLVARAGAASCCAAATGAEASVLADCEAASLGVASATSVETGSRAIGGAWSASPADGVTERVSVAGVVRVAPWVQVGTEVPAVGRIGPAGGVGLGDVRGWARVDFWSRETKPALAAVVSVDAPTAWPADTPFEPGRGYGAVGVGLRYGRAATWGVWDVAFDARLPFAQEGTVRVGPAGVARVMGGWRVTDPWLLWAGLEGEGVTPGSVNGVEVGVGSLDTRLRAGASWAPTRDQRVDFAASAGLPVPGLGYNSPTSAAVAVSYTRLFLAGQG